jgi:hypothetical protein
VTAYAVQTAPHAGLIPVAYNTPGAPATTGNTSPTGSDVAMLCKNASGASVNVDVHIPYTVDTNPVSTPAGGAGPARRFAVGAGADAIIPLPPEVYGDPANSSLATFDISAVTSISVAIVRF